MNLLSRSAPGQVRSRLFRDLILLILGILGLLALVSGLLLRGFNRDLAESRIGSATAQVRDEVRNVLGPVEQQLLIVRDVLRSAGLTPAAGRALDQRILPILAHMPQITGAIFADGSGAEWFLRRDGEAWLVRELGPGGVKQAKVTRLGAGGEPLESDNETLDYDPRTRPWYQGAIAAPSGLPSWTEPYAFHTLGVTGITTSAAWEQDGATRVVALDVSLMRVLATIDALNLGRDGRGFLFRGDGGVYVASGQDGSGVHTPEPDGFFSAEARLGGSLTFDAVSAWQEAGRPSDGLVRFRSGRREWWGGFLPLSNEPQSAWVAVIDPVPSWLVAMQGRWGWVLVTGLIILALGSWLARALVHKYSRQLRDLPKLSVSREDPHGDLLGLIGSGEGTHLEFKSTLRTNLHTGKPGKEIELAWLKAVTAFLNTEGGILLLGVADDGVLLGLNADGFENDDKLRLHFKNLLHHHIGPEYSRMVRMELYTLEGQQIAAVECERATAPAFLHTGKAESFLIRSGPSNLELPVSKAVKYIHGRF